MSGLRFVVALLVAVLAHSLGVRLWSDFAVYVDLFLILTVAWAFEATTLTGLAVGLLAGLTADTLAGGVYGLNGFANTLIGYLTAFSVAHLTKMGASGAVLLYALASVAQQVVLVALLVLLIPNGAPPSLTAMIGKIVITALAGLLIFRGRRKLFRVLGQWRQARESRLRF